MKNIFKSLLLLLAVLTVSCKDLVDGINDDPNGITISDVDPQLFLGGTMLANTVSQVGHLNRIAGMYSGQLVGLSSLYSNIYGYNLSTAESVGTWNAIYIGVIPNVRHIRINLPDDRLLVGISKVMEAMAIGTAASLFGDIPYEEINTEGIDDPKFDGQVDVLMSMIDLLTEATGDLSAATSRAVTEDLYFNGDKDKWMEAANTLKARYYMYLKDYSNAYSSAQNGISSSAGTMKHIPVGESSTAEDKNLFWEILNGSRTGDIGNVGSYLMTILDPSDAAYRGNAKTDETARFGYYQIDEGTASGNQGIIEQYEPQQIVSFEENHLILAEAGARTAGFGTGLTHLNEFRAWLNGGGRLNANFIGMIGPNDYQAYDAADFAAGTGMENADGIDATRALIREIVEERYVSGFGEYMPYDDARRLRKADMDVSVPFPFNIGTATAHPERMPYSDNELNTNANGPGEDPGIFIKTAVNQ
ncbi:MAG: SusD/RagB family nutrient-binding outer membrane lipoprotein [Bacteroidia bacterium]|nr:SusD/RagB family nutrient-binding outer membrane lipoprotein [Bacteroidia bacterium]